MSTFTTRPAHKPQYPKTVPTQQLDPIIMSTSHLTTTNPAGFFTEPRRGNCKWHSLISSPETNSDTFTVGIGVCEPEIGTLAMHRHKQAEIYYVLSGVGVLRIEGQDHTVKTGDMAYIPGDAEHGVFNYSLDEFRWLYCFGVGSSKRLSTGSQKSISHEGRYNIRRHDLSRRPNV